MVHNGYTRSDAFSLVSTGSVLVLSCGPEFYQFRKYLMLLTSSAWRRFGGGRAKRLAERRDSWRVTFEASAPWEHPLEEGLFSDRAKVGPQCESISAGTKFYKAKSAFI